MHCIISKAIQSETSYSISYMRLNSFNDCIISNTIIAVGINVAIQRLLLIASKMSLIVNGSIQKILVISMVFEKVIIQLN